MVEVCEAKGISHLIYGMYNYGNKRNSSLLEFKIRNGFEEYLGAAVLCSLDYHRVAMASRLGSTAESSEFFQIGVITTAIELREKWYNLRSFSRPA